VLTIGGHGAPLRRQHLHASDRFSAIGARGGQAPLTRSPNPQYIWPAEPGAGAAITPAKKAVMAAIWDDFMVLVFFWVLDDVKGGFCLAF
jgi:hypothetical protein